jgi:hypothetical protein
VSKVVFNPGDLVRVDRYHDFRLRDMMGIVKEIESRLEKGETIAAKAG